MRFAKVVGAKVARKCGKRQGAVWIAVRLSCTCSEHSEVPLLPRTACGRCAGEANSAVLLSAALVRSLHALLPGSDSRRAARMSAPLEPRDLSLPHGLDGPASAPSTSSATPPVRDAPSPDNAQDSESDGGNVSEGGTAEPFANLKLEREFEDDKRRDQRTAKLVMGPPLGGNESGSAGGAPAGDQVIEGEALAENEDILADLDDDALDLELTHLRLRTLRGLGVERFRKVQVR